MIHALLVVIWAASSGSTSSFAGEQKASRLACHASYNAGEPLDIRRNLVPVLLDDGMSYDAGWLPMFSIDLTQDKTRGSNARGAAWRAFVLKGTGHPDKIHPTVDVVVEPDGFSKGLLVFAAAHARKSTEHLSLLSRLEAAPWDKSFYAKTGQLEVKAVGGSEFRLTLESGAEGVDSIEFNCRFQ